ncbi:MAG: DNA polymerase III subunit beta [Proteobacteria bacterium]|nr:DNA polymerase III subunit beta [Pseudomonadota bacterium]
MKFSVSRDSLLKLLDPMNLVIEKRNSVPVLSNVKIELKDGKLFATATDNDMTMEGAIDATIDKDGITTVNASKLTEIVKKLSEGVALTATVDTNTDRMTITSGKARFNLACIRADGFPETAEITSKDSFEVEAEGFRKILTRSLFASSKDDSRQYLNGIYMHKSQNNEDEDVLCFVATDGHRLVKSEMPMPVGIDELEGAILPRKAVNQVVSISRDTPNIKVCLTESKAKFEIGDLTLTTRLIDSIFPDYNRVIPQSNDIEMIVSKDALMQVVDRVAIMSHEKSRSIRFEVKGSTLKIDAHNADNSGDAQEEIEVKYTGKDETVIGFNAQYLSELGKLLENDEVEFQFKSAVQSPVLLKDPKDLSSIYVLMPMRVQTSAN